MEKNNVMWNKVFLFFACTLQIYKVQWIAQSKCERPPHKFPTGRPLRSMTALPFPESWQTDRTVLRPYTPADEKNFLGLWSDPVVQRLSFIEYLSPTRTEQFLQRTIQAITSGSLFFMVAEEKERREFIGHVSLNFKPPSNRDAVVGIALKDGYRARGFGTELMLWLITHGFRELRLNRISLTVLEDNMSALKMYKKMYVRRMGGCNCANHESL